jgi:hypothetical protein
MPARGCDEVENGFEAALIGIRARNADGGTTGRPVLAHLRPSLKPAGSHDVFILKTGRILDNSGRLRRP